MPNSGQATLFASDLALQISQADAAERLRLRPKLDRALQNIRLEGLAVPRRLQTLNDELLDEAIEAEFDNLPV